MKKGIACLLAAVLLVGILPATLAGTEQENEVTFQVGFGREDVTPQLDNGTTYYLAGKEERTASKVTTSEAERLKMTAIALSDGVNPTKVVMTTDFIRVPVGWNVIVENVLLQDETLVETHKLAPGFLSMSATHTHSSIDIGDAYERGSTVINGQTAKHHTSNNTGNNTGKDTTYFDSYWLPGACEAVRTALADLGEPEAIKVTSETIPNMNWVRHWLNDDGTVGGKNFEEGETATKQEHIHEADPEMQLIRFVRADKKDIVLVNWQAHATGAMSNTGLSTLDKYLNPTEHMITADYCGVLRGYLEKQDADCFVAFFQGAAGNIAYTSDIENVVDTYTGYGESLGQKALAAMEDDTKTETVSAGKVQGLRNETAVVERGYKNTRTVQQDVITIGDSIAFVTAGYEMFDTNGMYIKENSPYEITFIIENAQGHEYMPDWQTNHYTLLGKNYTDSGPYETQTSQFNMVPGTAEDLADGLLHMLETLHNSADS